MSIVTGKNLQQTLALGSMRIMYQQWERMRRHKLPEIRRMGLKCKALGLIYHDHCMQVDA